MFAFDWLKGGPWDSRGIAGAHRFLDDLWKLASSEYEAQAADNEATTALRRAAHKTIQKVESDMVDFKWNTAVAAMMSLRNDLLAARRAGSVTPAAWSETVENQLKQALSDFNAGWEN